MPSYLVDHPHIMWGAQSLIFQRVQSSSCLVCSECKILFPVWSTTHFSIPVCIARMYYWKSDVMNICLRRIPTILGVFWNSPAHVMPLLEIVRAEQTSSQAIQDLIGLAKVIRKVPIVVQSCVGFAVNRIFFPYFQAAGLLVDLGLHPYRIDAIIKDFGMPMGPFRQFLWNLVKCFWILSVKIQWLTFFQDFWVFSNWYLASSS